MDAILAQPFSALSAHLISSSRFEQLYALSQ
jgi:hypothetical protein